MRPPGALRRKVAPVEHWRNVYAKLPSSHAQAGLGMDVPSEVALFVFSHRETKQIVEGLGFKVSGPYILNQRGRPVHFFCCDKPATVGHLGRIMPGSIDLICDDPVCFNRYLVAPVHD